MSVVTVASLSFVNLSAEETEAKNDVKQFELFGWYIAQQTSRQFESLELNDAEKDAFKKGFNDGISNPEDPSSKEAELRALFEVLQARSEAVNAKKAEAAAAASAPFFAELDKNEKVTKSESGLYYEIMEAGEEGRATVKDQVKVHYKGTLLDGSTFDSSYDRGEPATFPVSGVVPGFSEGVQLIGKGGKAKLYIPAELGYGERVPPGGPIPPNATLIFEVEMIEIIPAAE